MKLLSIIQSPFISRRKLHFLTQHSLLPWLWGPAASWEGVSTSLSQRPGVWSQLAPCACHPNVSRSPLSWMHSGGRNSPPTYFAGSL